MAIETFRQKGCVCVCVFHQMMLSAKFGENGPLGYGKEMYKQPSMEMMILRVKHALLVQWRPRYEK